MYYCLPVTLWKCQYCLIIIKWNLERFALMFTFLDSSHHENYLKHIFEMGVNRKFDFRWDWKFCWDFSNIFSGGTLYLSASYSFEFSQLNSLLSCMGLKSQDKIKRWKSLELSMDLWHVLVDCVPFLYWFFQYCLQ